MIAPLAIARIPYLRPKIHPVLEARIYLLERALVVFESLSTTQTICTVNHLEKLILIGGELTAQ